MEKASDKFVIVFWSVYDWESIRRRPMIRTLAQNLRGIANILYVCTPFSPMVTFFLNRDRYKRTIRRPLLEKISGNLVIFRPRAMLNLYTATRLGIQRAYWEKTGEGVKDALYSLGWLDYKRISWVNYPYQIYQIDVVDESFVVYECFDEYGGYFQDKKKNAWMSALEDKLFQKVHIVFATSKPLYESRKKMHPNVFLISNGVDLELFSKVAKVKLKTPEDIAFIPHPIIGYVGDQTSRFVDFDLLGSIASSHPDWSFVLIGSPSEKNDKEVKRFIKNCGSNVNILGEKKHEDIPSYLSEFDVCIMPFKKTLYTNNQNPLIMWEYLSAGKPTVSTTIDALEPLGSILFLADSKVEFVAHIQKILQCRKSGYLKQRLDDGIELAKEHSWRTVTQETAGILTDYFNSRSYDN